MQRLSKTFFLGSYLGGTIISIIIGWGIWAFVIANYDTFDTIETGPPPWVFILLALLVVPISIYVFVVGSVFIYKAWASIQDGQVRTSPCKALGFLFIPLFNFYWIFQAIRGFAVDFNEYTARNGINSAPKLPEDLFLAYCILYVVSIIPFIGFVTGLAYYIIGAILISKTCDAVNALPPPGVQDEREVAARIISGS